MSNVEVDQADTYKCYAENEFGRAVVTVTLNIIEGKNTFSFFVCELLQMLLGTFASSRCKKANIFWFLVNMFKGFRCSISYKADSNSRNKFFSFSWLQEEQSDAGGTTRSVWILYGSWYKEKRNLLKGEDEMCNSIYLQNNERKQLPI